MGAGSSPEDLMDLINPGWVAWVRVYDVVRPETPSDPRVHH